MNLFSFLRRTLTPLLVLCCFVCLGSAAVASAQEGFEGSSFPPPGWTFSGPAALGGVADSTSGITPTGGLQYGWISTGCSTPAISPGTTCPDVATMATPGYAALGLGSGAGLGSPTTETVLTSPSFTLTSSTQISFEVNFITTDGTTSFADLALVQLIPLCSTCATAPSPIDLFVANTTDAASAAVPPVDLNSGAGTMNPSTAFFSGTSVTFGASTYGNVPKFGGGPGGPTGWIQVTYVAPAGTYKLQFSVSHVGDRNYPSALAIDDVMTQTQTSPPQNFNSSTTNTTVPFIFSPTTGKYEQHNEIFPKGGNITCLLDPTCTSQLQVQDTKTPISNAVWPPYVGGTPWAISKLFPVASNGGTDQGSMYTIQCFDNTHPPVPGQCPYPTNPGPGSHVSAGLIFDLPAGVSPPAIAAGTTLAAIHYPPVPTMWSSSNTLPNGLCRNAMLATPTSTDPVDCPGEDVLVDKYGSTNAYPLSNTRNGSYALVYNVPMLCSVWTVNGMQVHNGCVQDNSTFFVRSPLTFDFLVTPAQLPAGFTIKNIASIQRTGGNTVTVTTSSNLPGTWMNGITLAIKPSDAANFPPVSAVISSVTANSFQYTQTGSNVNGNPSTGTVDDANGWVAAPVNKLFYAFDPFPGPDYPNDVLVRNDENLNDLDNCFAGSSNCPVAGTSPAQPGASSTRSVEFKTTPFTPVGGDGIYELQVSEADTARNRGMNIQLLNAGPCPEALPNSDANRPTGGWSPPCYKTALWFAKIGVDNVPPTITITTPQNNAVYVQNQLVPANYSCADTFSGVASCVGSVANGANIDTASVGVKTFTVNASDVAGNLATASVTYTVVSYNAFVQQPINPDGSSVFNASRGVIPVKFALALNGGATCALPAATIALTRTAGGTIGAIDESLYEMAADNGSNFRISGCQYIYNLAAKSLGPGVYRVDILINGVVVGSGVFALK